jgi:hypothetical protein
MMIITALLLALVGAHVPLSDVNNDVAHTPGDLPCCTVTPNRSSSNTSTMPCDPPPICGCKHPVVVLASCWGFVPADSTRALQAALDSGAETVVVPSLGRPWVLRANITKFGALQLRSNQKLILEQGVELLAFRGAFFGTGDCLVQGTAIENVTVIGYGASLRMWRHDYAAPPYARGEWRAGLSLRGVRNVKIIGLTIHETGGDGITVGETEMGVKGQVPTLWWSENVEIRSCTLHDNFRQGMSVSSAINLSVTDTVFANTAGTPPSAGADLEPWSAHHRLQGVRFSRCTFRNNSGVGVDVFLLALTNASAPVEIVLDHCEIIGGGPNVGHGGVRVAGVSGMGGPTGLVQVSETNVTNTSGPGALVEAKSYCRVQVNFSHCVFQNVASAPMGSLGWSPNLAPLWIDKMRKFDQLSNMTLGGVRFDACEVRVRFLRSPIDPYLRGSLLAVD